MAAVEEEAEGSDIQETLSIPVGARAIHRPRLTPTKPPPAGEAKGAAAVMRPLAVLSCITASREA